MYQSTAERARKFQTMNAVENMKSYADLLAELAQNSQMTGNCLRESLQHNDARAAEIGRSGVPRPRIAEWPLPSRSLGSVGHACLATASGIAAATKIAAKLNRMTYEHLSSAAWFHSELWIKADVSFPQ